jgi:hypothetical protein
LRSQNFSTNRASSFQNHFLQFKTIFKLKVWPDKSFYQSNTAAKYLLNIKVHLLQMISKIMRLQQLRELNLSYRAQFPSLLVPLSNKNFINVPVAFPTPFNEFIRLFDLKVNLFTIVKLQILQQVCILDHRPLSFIKFLSLNPIKISSCSGNFL